MFCCLIVIDIFLRQIPFPADTAVLSCELSDIILMTKTHITPKSSDHPIDAIDSKAIGSVDHRDLAQFTPRRNLSRGHIPKFQG
ncbi:hypothetical protein M0804_015489 [Polistes exclamans]|nr:hypothetical protein M0804_015489 [Polistes exclamans]